MRTNLVPLRVAAALAFVAILMACGEETPEPPAPTDCTARANANFKVHEVLWMGFKDTLVPTSIIKRGSQAAFVTDVPQTNYRWRIGNDARSFTTPTVRLFFDIDPVALDAGVRTQFTNVCGQTSTDSATAQFEVRDFDRKVMIGFYQGSTSLAPNDTFTIQVLGVPGSPVPDPPTLWVVNLPKTYRITVYATESFGYYKLYSGTRGTVDGGGNGESNSRVLAVIDPVTNRITCNVTDGVHSLATNRVTFRTYTFTGRRL